MEGYGSSHLKFANDLMCFVCGYYDTDWDRDFTSDAPSALRFTTEHADTVGRYLRWLDDGVWSVIHPLMEDPEELEDFLSGVAMLQDLFKDTVYSTHNYLFYCTLVAKFAVVSVDSGVLEAPFHAAFKMSEALTAFGLARNLSHSADFHQESSTRTIL